MRKLAFYCSVNAMPIWFDVNEMMVNPIGLSFFSSFSFSDHTITCHIALLLCSLSDSSLVHFSRLLLGFECSCWAVWLRLQRWFSLKCTYLLFLIGFLLGDVAAAVHISKPFSSPTPCSVVVRSLAYNKMACIIMINNNTYNNKSSNKHCQISKASSKGFVL